MKRKDIEKEIITMIKNSGKSAKVDIAGTEVEIDKCGSVFVNESSSVVGMYELSEFDLPTLKHVHAEIKKGVL
jgi:hypothetical protein